MTVKMTQEKTDLVALPMDHTILQMGYKHRDTNSVFFLDIDNTLYKENNGMDTEIRKKIVEYGCHYFTEDLANKYMSEYYVNYGHTLRGYLKEHKQCSLKDWVDIYNKIDIEKNLKYDKEMDDLLMLVKKNNLMIAFTNADYDVGYRMLKALGLLHVFDGLLYCEYKEGGDFLCKPDLEVYQFLEEYFKGKKLHIFEDRKCNLDILSNRNWYTYYITVENNLKIVLKELIAKEKKSIIETN